jgi:ribonucleotide monophosphatase NagD (HAD superfamily)
MGPGGTLQVDPSVRAVVVGLDTNINYYKIQYATQCVRELGAELIATNRSVTIRTSASVAAVAAVAAGSALPCSVQQFCIGRSIAWIDQPRTAVTL